MPTTIYLNDETAELAREMSERTGRPVAGLFREFLVRLKQAPDSLDNMALVVEDVQDSGSLGLNAPPLLGGNVSPVLGGEDDLSRFDKWIDIATTEEVVLVGITMSRPITNHQVLWRRFLEAGGRLRVLLQAQATIEPLRRIPADRWIASLKVLSELMRSTNGGNLEVRQCVDYLISYSAILISRVNGDVDIQIHPYIFSYRDISQRGPRFVLKVRRPSHTLDLVLKPIEAIWQSSPRIDEASLSSDRIFPP